MIITKVSTITGKTNTMDIPVNEEQIKNWQSGTVIQLAMPQLNAEQREFLISGATPEEWNELFGDEE